MDNAVLHETVQQHAEKLAELDKEQEVQGRDIAALKQTSKTQHELIGKLDEDISKLQEFIPLLAKKTDIDRVSDLVIGTFRDALNATPAKQGNSLNLWILVVMVITGVIVLVLGILPHGHP